MKIRPVQQKKMKIEKSPNFEENINWYRHILIDWKALQFIGTDFADRFPTLLTNRQEDWPYIYQCPDGVSSHMYKPSVSGSTVLLSLDSSAKCTFLGSPSTLHI